MIPGAEETMLRSVPDRKREVTEQLRHAVVAPRAIGAQNQLRIGGASVELVPVRPERRDEIGPGIDARVRDDPAAAVEGERLFVGGGVVDEREQRVTEARVPDRVHPVRIRTAETQVLGHPGEQPRVDGRAVEIQDAGNTRSSDIRNVGGGVGFDQLLAEQTVDELVKVGCNRRRLDVVFAEQLFVGGFDGAGVAEGLPLHVPTALRPRKRSVLRFTSTPSSPTRRNITSVATRTRAVRERAMFILD